MEQNLEFYKNKMDELVKVIESDEDLVFKPKLTMIGNFGYRLGFDGWPFDIIISPYSYGGNEGFFESRFLYIPSDWYKESDGTYTMSDSVSGWLTIEDVIKRLKAQPHY